MEKIAESLTLINVGKECARGPCYWTTFYDCKGLTVDSGCPHTAEESATFIEKRKLDVRIVMKIDRKLPLVGNLFEKEARHEHEAACGNYQFETTIHKACKGENRWLHDHREEVRR